MCQLDKKPFYQDTYVAIISKGIKYNGNKTIKINNKNQVGIFISNNLYLYITCQKNKKNF